MLVPFVDHCGGFCPELGLVLGGKLFGLAPNGLSPKRLPVYPGLGCPPMLLLGGILLGGGPLFIFGLPPIFGLLPGFPVGGGPLFILGFPPIFGLLPILFGPLLYTGWGKSPPCLLLPGWPPPPPLLSDGLDLSLICYCLSSSWSSSSPNAVLVISGSLVRILTAFLRVSKVPLSDFLSSVTLSGSPNCLVSDSFLLMLAYSSNWSLS